MTSEPPKFLYATVLTVVPTIIISGMIKYDVKRLVIGKQTIGRTRRICVPVALCTMAESEWSLDEHQIKGVNNNTYHGLVHSNCNGKYSDPFWLHKDATPEVDSGAVSLRVVNVWPNQDNPDRDLTLVVSVPPSESTQMFTVCEKIGKELQKNTSNLFPKFKATKKSKWPVQMYEPRKRQSADEIEKYGARDEDWYKVKVALSDSKSMAKTPVYMLKTNVEKVSANKGVSELLETDPEILVEEGTLVRCNSGMDIRPGAELLIAVCVSKVDTSPKFAFSFRAKYIVALSMGSDEMDQEIVLSNGTLAAPTVLSVSDYLEAIRSDASSNKRKLADRDEKDQICSESE
jgi:hypothetical protein